LKARRLTLIGVLVIACLISASVGGREAHAAPAAQTLWGNVAFVGRDVVDLRWYPEAEDLGYKITRDGDLIAELGAEATFFRDTEPLSGTHTYTLYRVTTSGDQPDPGDTVTLGAIEGMLYEDLTWSSGTYDVAVNVEVMPGVTLSIAPGVEVSAKSQTFHPHGLFGAGVLDVDGAILDVTDLWIQGNGSEIKNSEFLPGFHSIYVDADARLEGNVFNSALYFDFGEAAEVEMVGNTLKGGILFFRSMDQAALTMERNVFSQPASGEVVLSLGSTAPAVVSDNRFEGCPYLDGVLQVNGSGAVTIQDNAFRCSESNRYSALAIAVNSNNPGVIERNVFEGPYRYGGSNDAAAIQINPGAGIAVEDNLFHEWPVAVRVNGGTGALTRNTFFNNGHSNGIVVDGDGGTELRQNCILSTLEITNRTTPLDATLNWWGDPSGPFHEDNLDGEGWRIDGGPVNYDPWLTDEADAPCNVVDLTLAGAEVVQSVQSLANSVPLVAGKPALMRIYADSAAGSVSSVPVVVRGYRDGASLGVRATLADAAPVRDVDGVRNDPNGGATIELPGTWLTGTVTLVTEINPDHSPSEIRYDNNVLTQTISFDPRRSMRLAYVPVTYAPEADSATTPTAGNLPKLHTTMARLYPLPGVDYAIWSPLTWPLEMSDAAEEEEERADLVVGLLTLKLAIFNASRPTGEQMDQIFGYFPGGTLRFCYSDPPWDGGRGVASYCADGGMWMAHEIGHNLGLRHPNTPDSGGADDSDTYWPYPTAETQEVGYDVPADEMKPSSYFDFMSYRDASEQWISPLHYRKLFDALPEPESTAAALEAQADATYLLISGQVTVDDVVSFQPVWRVDASVPPVNPAEGTEYCVEMRDGGGSVLQSQCFDLSFFNYEAGQAVTSDFFMVSLPLDAGAASIVLTRGAEDLGAVEPSANPPQVTLLSPSGGEFVGESVTVQWTASDPDGDDLAYNVLYSADDVGWEPLALNVTGATSVDLDLSFAPGSTSARFRVEVSDGYHTAYDESDGTVTVGDRQPLVTIVAPQDGVTTSGALTLEGVAYDPEDGPLTGASLTWSSDRDGSLGTGETLEGVTLSGGGHVLTLKATDSEGQSTGASVSVTVETAASGLTATNDGPTRLGEPTTFTASVTEGTNVSYDWDFGDGGSGAGKTVEHTYAVTGTFTATVTASNAGNAVAATTVAVVTSASEPPDGHRVYLPLVMRR
jgi:hypothetical protein